MIIMNALSVKNLCKTYAGGHQALKGISLTVQKGDFFGLLGPNGAGKSTMIGVITSLVRKTAGQVAVFQHDIDLQHTEAKRMIGLMPQEFNFNIFAKVIQIVVNQAGYYGVPRNIALERAEHYLNKIGLWEKRHTAARFLSGGMKRRLMIARALMHEPQLLILDEPTAGVDVELRHFLWDYLQELNDAGVTIILTTHYLEEAETLCRNIAIIDQGLLIENTGKQTLLNKLHKETFLLTTTSSWQRVPVIEGYVIEAADETTLSVRTEKGKALNPLFVRLAEENIQVTSIRNKTNPLEELFLSLTGKVPHEERK